MYVQPVQVRAFDVGMGEGADGLLYRAEGVEEQEAPCGGKIADVD